MATVIAGEVAGGFNFDRLDFRAYLGGQRVLTNATTIANETNAATDTFTGQFVFNSDGQLIDGTLSGFREVATGGSLNFELSGFSVSVTSFLSWINFGNNEAGRTAIMAGADTLSGSNFNDVLRGYASNDTIDGRAGDDYLRGDDGADRITGGAGFDDINGNMGDDTASGGQGDDWVVGGKDQDLLSGDEGADIVYGNIGNDWCDGGLGADIIRGGQDNDTLFGQEGEDWLSGDRGADTITGGAGADIFHTFNEAGIDRVLDFHRSEGDRVQLDPGTSWAMAQVGADVVITLGAGESQMILVDVKIGDLTGGWIFTV